MQKVDWGAFHAELKLVREFNWGRSVRCQDCERVTRRKLSKHVGQRLRNQRCDCGGRLRLVTHEQAKRRAMRSRS